MTTKSTRQRSQPPAQQTRQPSMRWPSGTAWKSRKNLVCTGAVRGCRCWLRAFVLSFMFSPRPLVFNDSHMNALWVGRGKQNLERVRKRRANGALIPTASAAAFHARSLSRLSHNECRRWLLTKRLSVRILFGEPNISTSRSARFWLTATWREFLQNGPILRETRSLRERLCSAGNGGMTFPLRVLGPYSQSLRIGPLVWLTALTAPAS